MLNRLVTLPALPIIAMLAMILAACPGRATAAAAPQHLIRIRRHHVIVFYPTRHLAQQWYQISFAAQGSGDLQYNGGPVQHVPVSYLIFWGSGWDNGAGGPDRTGQIIESYFNNLSGSSFENILTQYYDSTGNIQNTESIGGVWVDDAAPPSDNSCGGPTIEDSAIQNEVANAINTNGWPADSANAIYFVYTDNGYYVNQGGSCSEQQFCAYHGWDSLINVAYAAMPYPLNGNCYVPSSPNGDIVADSEINVSSHEEFEAITDPQPGSGWVDAAGYEIGDKCAWDFSAGYTYLQGQAYEVQTEYSNASSSCVNSY
jgi:hypothetical protein